MARMVSCALMSASSSVSPSVTTSGRAGTSTVKPPPSWGSRMTEKLKFCDIGLFLRSLQVHQIDQTHARDEIYRCPEHPVRGNNVRPGPNAPLMRVKEGRAATKTDHRHESPHVEANPSEQTVAANETGE